MKINVIHSKQPLYEAIILDEDILNGCEFFVGRESDCHIQLDSYRVSRYHLKICMDEGVLKLEVLSDYGGVNVNGNEVRNCKLNEGDQIQLDGYEIKINEIPEFLIKEDVISVDDKLNTEQIQKIDDETKGNVAQEVAEFQVDKNPEEILGDLVGPIGVDEKKSDPELEVDNNFSAESDFGQNENIAQESEPQEFDSEPDSTSDDDVTEEENFSDGEFGDQGIDNGDGFDDGFNEEFAGESSASNEDSTQVLQTFAKFSLKLFGEFAPFDRYLLDRNEIFIGRDTEKCQIILNDPEVSKVHAVIKKTLVDCTLIDLDSANGIILNGERVNESVLTNGDEFIIGDTSFSVEVSSDILEAEKGLLMPVEDNQEVEIEEIIEEEVDFDTFDENTQAGESSAAEEKSLIKRIMKDPKKKRMVIIGIIIAVFLFLLSDDDTGQMTGDNTKIDPKKSAKLLAKKNKIVLTDEQKELREQYYALVLAKFEEGAYYEAKEYIDKAISIDPNYKQTQSLKKLIQEGLDDLVRLKQKEQEEKDRKERQIKINALLEKAKEAVKKRQVQAAKNYFGLIYELDPENIDVPSLKIEIDAWADEQRRIKQEKAILKANRQTKIDKLTPGKALYLKGEWYKAIDRLDKFMRYKDMDEDLITEATKMLKDAQRQLMLIVNPLLSKARSFKEGEDLKQAYETYGEVLKFDPTSVEALNNRDEIFLTLRNRSRKVYRDALVAESLSLFSKAKEKFQEVQQISPINSEYYLKATEKLKNYLE